MTRKAYGAAAWSLFYSALQAHYPTPFPQRIVSLACRICGIDPTDLRDENLYEVACELEEKADYYCHLC